MPLLSIIYGALGWYTLCDCGISLSYSYFAQCTLMKRVFVRMNAISRSAVGNVSGNRCEADGRSRGREFDPDPVLYFRRD